MVTTEKISYANASSLLTKQGFKAQWRRLYSRCKPLLPWYAVSFLVLILFLLTHKKVVNAIPHTFRLVYGFPDQAEKWSNLPSEYITPGKRDARFNYPFDSTREKMPEFPHTAAVFAVPFILNALLLRGTAIFYQGAAFLVSNSIVLVLKAYVGALRPNFYNRCEYDDKAGECKNKDEEIEARSSFPSGHSSGSAVVMGFWAWDWVALFSATWPAWRFYFPIFSIIPAIIACFICLTRYLDYYHFEHDILAGIAIGGFVAYYFYNMMVRIRVEEDDREKASKDDTDFVMP